MMIGLSGVSQVVRHDTEHQVSRRHRTLERRLDALAIGDVAKHDGKEPLAADRDLGNRRLGRKLLPTLAKTVDLHALGHRTGDCVAGGEGCKGCAVLRAGTDREATVEGRSDHLLLRVTEDLLGAFIEHNDALIRVDRNDGVGGNGDNPRELGLGALKRALGPFALGDVLYLRDVAERGVIRPAQDRAAEHDVDHGAILADVALLELVARNLTAASSWLRPTSVPRSSGCVMS